MEKTPCSTPLRVSGQDNSDPNITTISISKESVDFQIALGDRWKPAGKSDEELLKDFKENVLPALRSRTEQVFPQVTTQNKLEKTTAEWGDLYTLTGEKEDCIILYLHGGAWIYEMTDIQVLFCDKLVNEFNAKVYMPLYPLAPQADYKQAYKMIEAVYDELLKFNKPIIMMGDSAGGNISLALTLKLKGEGKRLPDYVVAIAPCADLSMTNPEINEYAKLDSMLPLVRSVEYGKLWANGTDLTDPAISPLYGNFSGFPDTMLIHGTYDILYPDTKAMYEKMRASGVRASMVIGEGFWHIFCVFPIKEQQQILDLMKEFCK